MEIGMIENPMVVGRDEEFDAYQKRNDFEAAMHKALRDELIGALLCDPTRKVRTPGFNESQMSAASAIFDHLAGDEEALNELLNIVAMASKGGGGKELHLRASAWIAERGKEHADYHYSDAVRKDGL
jgi:hypothetical protein